jgi:hypothetical protein
MLGDRLRRTGRLPGRPYGIAGSALVQWLDVARKLLLPASMLPCEPDAPASSGLPIPIAVEQPYYALVIRRTKRDRPR